MAEDVWFDRVGRPSFTQDWPPLMNNRWPWGSTLGPILPPPLTPTAKAGAAKLPGAGISPQRARERLAFSKAWSTALMSKHILPPAGLGNDTLCKRGDAKVRNATLRFLSLGVRPRIHPERMCIPTVSESPC